MQKRGVSPFPAPLSIKTAFAHIYEAILSEASLPQKDEKVARYTTAQPAQSTQSPDSHILHSFSQVA